MNNVFQFRNLVSKIIQKQTLWLRLLMTILSKKFILKKFNRLLRRRRDIQHNDTQHNDIEHNDTQHKEHSDTRHQRHLKNK